MTTRWQRWTAWLTAEEDALPLALCRVICAGTVALHVGRFVLTGAADAALLHADYGGLSYTHGWLEPVGGATIASLRILCAVCAIAGTSAALGLFTRPSLAVTWLSLRAITSLNPSAHGSYDSLLIDTLFVLMLSDCGKALSLDARLRGKGGPAMRWARFLLVFQLGLLYIGSGITKLSASWVPGGSADALWYILQQPTWARFPGLPLWSFPVTQVATTLTWFYEVGGPLLFFAIVLEQIEPRRRWLRRLKERLERVHFVSIYLAFGAAMHVGIELTMEVGPFSLAALALYPAALGPRRIEALVRWLGSRGAQVPASRSQ